MQYRIPPLHSPGLKVRRTAPAHRKQVGGYSLGLVAQLVCFLFPDGEGVRGDHVKREIPGMRGRTKNQRIRKPA